MKLLNLPRGTPRRTRTYRFTGLSRLPMPIRLGARMVPEVGLEPTIPKTVGSKPTMYANSITLAGTCTWTRTRNPKEGLLRPPRMPISPYRLGEARRSCPFDACFTDRCGRLSVATWCQPVVLRHILRVFKPVHYFYARKTKKDPLRGPSGCSKLLDRYTPTETPSLERRYKLDSENKAIMATT